MPELLLAFMRNDSRRSKSLSVPPFQMMNVLPLRRVFVGRLAADHAVLDAPQPRIAVPAAQVLAVEQRLHVFRFRRAGRGSMANTVAGRARQQRVVR